MKRPKESFTIDSGLESSVKFTFQVCAGDAKRDEHITGDGEEWIWYSIHDLKTTTEQPKWREGANELKDLILS